MRIRRTVPPTAAPIAPMDLLHGLFGLLSGGEKHRTRLERELRSHFSVKHVFLVSSGKAALALTLLALGGESKRRQVVIPAYTCFSVPSSVVKAGLEIVPCDIDPVTFDFDYHSLARKVTENTLCVLAVHLFGIPADLPRINKICKDAKAFVVEDAAQAMGGQLNGKMLGTLGDVGFYSLGRGKNITCGSAGVVVTNSDSIAAALTRSYAELKECSLVEDLKNFVQLVLMSLFIRPMFYWLPVAMPFLKLGETIFYKDFPLRKLSARRAALLRNWRHCLVESNRVRAQNAFEVSNKFAKRDIDERCIPFLRFPILAPDRQTKDIIYGRSRAKGLGFSLMYPVPVNEIAELKAAFAGEVFPGAKRVAETLLTLPTHYLLSVADKKAIRDLLSSTATLNTHETMKSVSGVDCNITHTLREPN